MSARERSQGDDAVNAVRMVERSRPRQGDFDGMILMIFRSGLDNPGLPLDRREVDVGLAHAALEVLCELDDRPYAVDVTEVGHGRAGRRGDAFEDNAQESMRSMG